MTGRYVIFELAQGTFNPGGAELALTLNAPAQLEGLAIHEYETGVAVIWNSNVPTTYEVERTYDGQNWSVIAPNVVGCASATSYNDTWCRARPLPDQRS